VPHLPENRIGEPVPLSELKRLLAGGRKPEMRPILVSFAGQAETFAGTPASCKRGYRRRRPKRAANIIRSKNAPADGSGTAEAAPLPLPAALPNLERQNV
jgi:hypothetical protein